VRRVVEIFALLLGFFFLVLFVDFDHPAFDHPRLVINFVGTSTQFDFSSSLAEFLSAPHNQLS
jgi:hypothetical protein